MGTWVIVSLSGLVAVGVVGWTAYHVRRELLGRRHVRAALRTTVTVAELRARCNADSMPRYPVAS